MKTFVNYYYIPAVIIISSVLSLPVTSEFIKKGHPVLTTWLAIFVIISSAVNYYFNQLKLFAEQEKTIKKMQITIPVRREIAKFVKPYESHKVSVHILIPHKEYLVKLEPKKGNPQAKKLSWSCNVFKPEWQLGNHMHNELKITTKQGYIGAAYEAGPFTSAKFGVLNAPNVTLPDFNFTTQQQNLLQGIVFVACCAIPDVNKDGKSVGVLSIDSYKTGSEVLITNDDIFKGLLEAMEDLAIVLGDHLKDYQS